MTWVLLLFFGMFLKLTSFQEDSHENVRAELINLIFCYQSLLSENYFLPKEAATKYKVTISFAKYYEKCSRQIYYKIT